MKYIIIGFGKMGKAVDAVAKKNAHTLLAVIDNEEDWNLQNDKIREADIAFEFTEPLEAAANIRHCFALNIPVVSGTTGWNEEYEAVKAECIEGGHSLFTASNFSIGVNILMEINRQLVSIMNRFPQYDLAITETHHVHKLDAPSGTAITIAKDLIRLSEHKNAYSEVPSGKSEILGITSYREGEVPGTHKIIYESSADIIELNHIAKSREGLASGAVSAAEWLLGKRGVYGMFDLLGFGSIND